MSRMTPRGLLGRSYLDRDRMAITRSFEVAVFPLVGDPLRFRQLRTFLEKEAATFHATVAIENLITAVKKNQIQVLFLLVGGEVVGCATQFPTAIPEWNRDQGKVYFMPAVHSEDMSVDRKGSGAPFMQRRVIMAANEGKTCGFDLGGKVRAGALVGEQSWHSTAAGERTAIGGLLSKFSTEMAKDRSDTVLRLSSAKFPDATAMRDIRVWSLAHIEAGKTDGVTVRHDVFAVTWGPDVDKIAATFTIGTSTFTGCSVVRVHINSNRALANDPDVKFAIANIFAAGRRQILARCWIEKGVDPLDRMYVHSLGEKAIRHHLKDF